MQGQILDCEPVTAAADPWTVLAAAMQRLSAAGWTIENDGRRGRFFCHREGVRRVVHLRPTDPAVPSYGPSWYPACPGCEE